MAKIHFICVQLVVQRNTFNIFSLLFGSDFCNRIKAEWMREISVRDRYFDMNFIKKWTIFFLFFCFRKQRTNFTLFFFVCVCALFGVVRSMEIRKYANYTSLFGGGYECERPSRTVADLKIGSYHAPKAKHTSSDINKWRKMNVSHEWTRFKRERIWI